MLSCNDIKYSGDILVKKERSGIGIVHQAVESAEEILRENKPCTPERMAYIRTGRLALNDMAASKSKIQISNRLKNAIVHCEKDKDGICKSSKHPKR